MKLSFSKISGHLHPSTALLLWLCVIVVLVCEGLVLKSAVGVLRQARFADPRAKPGSTILVDFTAYDQAVERITQAQNYVPQDMPQVNPFRNFEVPKK